MSEFDAKLTHRLTRAGDLIDNTMSDRAATLQVQPAARKLDRTTVRRTLGSYGVPDESVAGGATIFKMQVVSRHKTVPIL